MQDLRKYEHAYPMAYPWNDDRREDVPRYFREESGWWKNPTAQPSGKALISCVGDLICEPRLIRANRYGDSVFFHPLFQYVRDLLRQSDLSMGNLETNVTDFTPERDPEASVRLTKYTPRYLDYEYNTNKPGTIVFSEIYYPYGWKATIDGHPIDIFRVNYMLRAINVPAGKHAIHMEFDPDSVKKGDTIAMVCIIIMYATILLVIGLALYRTTRKRML